MAKSIEDYIGIPWLMGGRDENVGLDCWGWVRYYYEDCLGIILPTYDGISKFENGTKDCSNIITHSPTYADFERFDSPQQDDIAMFMIGGFPIHVGVVVDDKLMLHADDPKGVIVDNYLSLIHISEPTRPY